MKTIAKTLQLSNVEYYITHLSIINCVLPAASRMTPMEIKILAWFMSFSGELSKDRFGALPKRIIREHFQISHQGLSNYLISLQKKGCIVDRDGSLSILPVLQPEKNEQIYMIKLVNKYL